MLYVVCAVPGIHGNQKEPALKRINATAHKICAAMRAAWAPQTNVLFRRILQYLVQYSPKYGEPLRYNAGKQDVPASPRQLQREAKVDAGAIGGAI